MYPIEMDVTKWLWGVEGSIILWNYGAYLVAYIWFYQKVFKNVKYSLQLKTTWYIFPKKSVFEHQNKAEFKNLDASEVHSYDFPGPKSFADSLASVASATSVTSTLQPYEVAKATRLMSLQSHQKSIFSLISESSGNNSKSVSLIWYISMQ